MIFLFNTKFIKNREGIKPERILPVLGNIKFKIMKKTMLMLCCVTVIGSATFAQTNHPKHHNNVKTQAETLKADQRTTREDQKQLKADKQALKNDQNATKATKNEDRQDIAQDQVKTDKAKRKEDKQIKKDEKSI